MRTIAIIVVFVSYLCGINFYIVSYGLIEPIHSKEIYLWFSFFTISYCGFDVYKGIVSQIHKWFISLCMAGIAGNFLIMILYFQFDIEDYFWRFIIFNGLCLITSIFILISGIRNSLFKNTEIDSDSNNRMR